MGRTATATRATDLLAATNLEEPSWTRAIRQLVDAGLVGTEGERRWTRYRLTHNT